MSEETPSAPAFEDFAARNTRRSWILAAVAILFMFIRLTGVRAGALMLVTASTMLLPLSVLNPQLGLYALVMNFVNEFDTYYRLQQYTIFSLPFLFNGAVVAGILLQVVIPGRTPRLGYAQNLLLVAYVLLVTLSAVFSETTFSWPLFRTRFLARLLIYLFLILLITRPRDLHRLLLVFVVAHVLSMLTSFSDYLQSGVQLYRIQGTHTEINYLAYVCVTTLPLLISLFVYLRDRLSRYAMVATTTLTLFVTLQTLSRSAVFALIAVVGFLAYRLLRSPRMLLTAAAFAVFFYLFTPTTLVDRLQEIESVTETGRYRLSTIGLRMALDNPVLGVGWGAYEENFLRYDYEGLYTGQKGPHSLYFAIAARSGFPALLIYLSIYGITFWQTRALEKQLWRAGAARSLSYSLLVGIEGGLVGHFVFGLAGSYPDTYHAYFLLALAVILVRYHHDHPGSVLR